MYSIFNLQPYFKLHLITYWDADLLNRRLSIDESIDKFNYFGLGVCLSLFYLGSISSGFLRINRIPNVNEYRALCRSSAYTKR